MKALFARARTTDVTALGVSALALSAPAGSVVPPGCGAVLFDQGGQTRRLQAGARIACRDHERALLYHPGPYSADLQPFAAAPEMGLRLGFGVDSADPRLPQQRFDLFLASEGADGMALAALCGRIEQAVQHELAQGNLALPPCTTLDEWERFRAGLNELLYTRFGLSVADCVPVDLGESVDYAQLLLARADGAAAPACLPAAAAPEPDDAAVLRRLFLELPCVTAALRALVLPPGQALFARHQALLQRLTLVGLAVATMPALALAAPGVPLPAPARLARARHGVAALAALDEAWAWLARAPQMDSGAAGAILDDAERIVANLELACAARRAVP